MSRYRYGRYNRAPVQDVKPASGSKGSILNSAFNILGIKDKTATLALDQSGLMDYQFNAEINGQLYPHKLFKRRKIQTKLFDKDKNPIFGFGEEVYRSHAQSPWERIEVNPEAVQHFKYNELTGEAAVEQMLKDDGFSENEINTILKRDIDASKTLTEGDSRWTDLKGKFKDAGFFPERKGFQTYDMRVNQESLNDLRAKMIQLEHIEKNPNLYSGVEPPKYTNEELALIDAYGGEENIVEINNSLFATTKSNPNQPAKYIDGQAYYMIDKKLEGAEVNESLDAISSGGQQVTSTGGQQVVSRGYGDLSNKFFENAEGLEGYNFERDYLNDEFFVKHVTNKNVTFDLGDGKSITFNTNDRIPIDFEDGTLRGQSGSVYVGKHSDGTTKIIDFGDINDDKWHDTISADDADNRLANHPIFSEGDQTISMELSTAQGSHGTRYKGGVKMGGLKGHVNVKDVSEFEGLDSQLSDYGFYDDQTSTGLTDPGIDDASASISTGNEINESLDAIDAASPDNPFGEVAESEVGSKVGEKAAEVGAKVLGEEGMKTAGKIGKVAGKAVPVVMGGKQMIEGFQEGDTADVIHGAITAASPWLVATGPVGATIVAVNTIWDLLDG